jgi:uncharacterized protein (TIGR02271 family)
MRGNEPTRQARRVWEIDRGWDVISSDGEKIGEVAEVRRDSIVVEKGFLFKSDFPVPVSAIADVTAGRIYLAVPRREIERLRPGGNRDAVPPARLADPEPSIAGGRSGSTVPMSMPLVEEELHPERRPVPRGRVQMQKRVAEEAQSLDVPLREESIRIERRLVDQPFGIGNVPADAFQELDIEIPIRAEEAVTLKQTVLREEVLVHKDVVVREQTLSGTVPREEVQIEPERLQPPLAG